MLKMNNLNIIFGECDSILIGLFNSEEYNVQMQYLFEGGCLQMGDLRYPCRIGLTPFSYNGQWGVRHS